MKIASRLAITNLLLAIATSAMASPNALPKSIDKNSPEAAKLAVEMRQSNEAANAIYDQLFPYYIEACATSSYHPLKGEDGGSYGHGIMLIHGACRDNANPDGPQQLRFCAENPRSTVGISTDAQYHNVNWTVVDTRSAMLYGDHPADQPYTAETRLKQIRDSLQMGVYRNVIAKSWNQKEADQMGLTLNQWMAQFGLGTNYALTMARGVSCTRIPLVGTKPGKENGPLLEIIKYLNDLNRRAWKDANNGKKLGYQYEYIVDNCTHPTANALAQIGLVHERNTNLPGPQTKLDQFFRQWDFAIPYNTMFEAFQESIVRTETVPIIRNLLEKPKALAALKNWGWLFSQPGVIIEELPSHTYQNSYFVTDINRSFFSMWAHFKQGMNDQIQQWLGMRLLPENDQLLAKFERDLANPATVEIGANLEKWQAIYENLLHDRQLDNGREIETELKNYLIARLAQTKELLKRLEVLRANQNSNLRSK